MRNWMLLSLLFFTAIPGQVLAEKRNLGVGIIFDDPLMITAKKWLDGSTAIDAAISIEDEGGDDSRVNLHVDYLKHDFSVFDVKQGSLPVHYGIGIKLEDDDDLTTSLRVPVGLTYHFEEFPLDAFFEYALLVEVSGSGSLNSETMFGIRYYF